jgi:hypothetical protein
LEPKDRNPLTKAKGAETIVVEMAAVVVAVEAEMVAAVAADAVK